MTGWHRIWLGAWGLSVGMVATALVLAHAEPGGLAERGRTLYAQHCAICHGLEGQGRAQGNATALNNPDFLAWANCHGWEGRGELGMGPALNNPDFLAAADDTFLWATIAYGRRETPMFPSLRGLGGVRQFIAAEINDLVTYLRTWQGPR